MGETKCVIGGSSCLINIEAGVVHTVCLHYSKLGSAHFLCHHTEQSLPKMAYKECVLLFTYDLSLLNK